MECLPLLCFSCKKESSWEQATTRKSLEWIDPSLPLSCKPVGLLNALCMQYIYRVLFEGTNQKYARPYKDQINVCAWGSLSKLTIFLWLLWGVTVAWSASAIVDLTANLFSDSKLPSSLTGRVIQLTVLSATLGSGGRLLSQRTVRQSDVPDLQKTFPDVIQDVILGVEIPVTMHRQG